ncbi:ankyrin repeat-containing domain protein [Cercophora samala]|uniref:Ankyrin repeat-containing domain protein n=1 Tax=Cercophora samala TaxID=330535 RepID=A0AA39ZKQ5_9PEZI|nr:ankyrin repeat-containing domain protein [Cercophora samala]
MKLLLQKVVIIKTESPSGTTHLRRAIRQNLQHLITVLHEAGAEFNIEDEKNAAPLLFAAEAGHAEIIKILMDYKRTETSSCPNSQSNRVDTPLHQAAKDGDASVVDQLVRSGADLESRNHSHQTPLALAVEMCQVAVVRGLLHHGADPQSTLLLSLAVDSNKTEGTRLEIVRTLLLAGANIEVESAHGRTALHIAAQLGYTTIMEFLLENGAKTETEDTWGYTPMEWASRWGRRDSVQVLLAHEAKVNMGNTGEVRLPT